jgi:hypothetical protein
MPTLPQIFDCKENRRLPKTHYLHELIKRLSEVYEKPEINNYLLEK